MAFKIQDKKTEVYILRYLKSAAVDAGIFFDAHVPDGTTSEEIDAKRHQALTMSMPDADEWSDIWYRDIEPNMSEDHMEYALFAWGQLMATEIGKYFMNNQFKENLKLQ